jgi:hypothetical protein
MNLGKFSCFCNDFGLLQGDKKLKRDEMLEIFKRHSTYSKEATFDQFETIAQKLAETIYKDDPKTRDDTFFKRLGLDAPNKMFKEKIRNFILPFHSKDKPSD